MAKLIYSVMTSLDGYVADADGKFDWAVPDAEVHAFFNDLERPVGTYLYGRRMYEVMVGWETAHARADQAPFVPGSEVPERDFAKIWRAADKIAYSKTLETVCSARARIEPEVVQEEVRQMKGRAGGDITVGGPDLTLQAIAVRWSTSSASSSLRFWWQAANERCPAVFSATLELHCERRFHSGLVFLHYLQTKRDKGE